jgi:hypothetical protein
MQVYKKIKQSEKRKKRSVDVTSAELQTIQTINEKFLELFKIKHLS